jgi:hypothetical protein
MEQVIIHHHYHAQCNNGTTFRLALGSRAVIGGEGRSDDFILVLAKYKREKIQKMMIQEAPSRTIGAEESRSRCRYVYIIT